MASESGTYSPETIARRQKIADALLMQAVKPREIRSPIQGLGQLGESALAGWEGYRADRDEKAARTEAVAQALAAFGGGGGQMPAGPAAAPVAAPQGAPASAAVQSASMPAPTPTSDFMPNVGGLPAMAPDPAAKAIAGIESGGRYDLLGPPTKGDRAYGKYQVMGANVPAWTKAHLGQEMTPQEFLANPAAQDAVFKGQFGQYQQKYGPEGAARAWFAGEGGMNDMGRKDVLGTSVADYASKFRAGGGTQVASLDPRQGAIPNVAGALNGPQPAAGSPPAQAPLPPPQQVVQNAPASTAVAQAPAVPNREAIVRAMMNDWVPPAVKSALVSQMNPSYGFQTLPDGTIVRTNPRTGQIDPVYHAPTKPTWGIIGETADGGKQYGWIDAGAKAKGPGGGSGIEAYNPPGATGAPATVSGPDGKPIPIPPGVNAKEFVKRVSESTADALTGKKTEVQAKDEKFANKMELAEKNIKDVEGEGTSIKGRGLEAKIPGTNMGLIPGSNFMQSDKYQQYRQAQNNFITALLRDESGAAIGSAEFDRYEKEMFPQPGDGQKVIEQKREARRIAIEAMKKGAGPAYKPPTALAGPVKVSSPEEASKLPKGTKIILPDGSPGEVP